MYSLGWTHHDAGKLQALQDRLRYAVRTDRAGDALVDYQTVDMGTPWMLPALAGWTTRGEVAERSGANSQSTHQRYRHYRADSIHTVALTLVGETQPDVEVLEASLRRPSRPLFIGRKCCLPAAPICLGIVEAPSLIEALATCPRVDRADPNPIAAFWDDGDPVAGGLDLSHVLPVTDERDWATRLHVGRRLIRQGFINPPEAVHG